MREINKQSVKNNTQTSCLIQIHIAEEVNKFGFNYNEFLELVLSNRIKEFNNIHFKGLMGMATNTKNKNKVAEEFKLLKSYYNEINKHKLNYKIYKNPSNIFDIMIKSDFAIISFGVTAYELANLGIPSFYISLSDDHLESSRLFVANGLGFSIGIFSFHSGNFNYSPVWC